MNTRLVQSSVLAIQSYGRGAIAIGSLAAGSTWTVQPFVSTDYDQDIVWADGYFVRWPK
jgi:hypothetical protein